MSARGTRKEEFDYIETLMRNPRRIQQRKKREMIEEDADPRKEVLSAYQVSWNCGHSPQMYQR
jgi:hypothetical protein